MGAKDEHREVDQPADDHDDAGQEAREGEARGIEARAGAGVHPRAGQAGAALANARRAR
jgi:hypothetical protein